MWPALEGNRPLAWNGCWSSQWESDSLKQTHDAHRTRTATLSLASRLFNCKHDFPGATSVFEMGYFYQPPPTYSRYLSLEFPHVSQLHQLSSRNQRISVRNVGCTSAVGHMQHPFSSRIVPAAPVPLAPGCRTSSTPGSWPKLAPSPISRSLASA
ncbi:uncharacterized protein K444DRAFT_4645 [Hyaloscypha bicolor E]|uniref:Uncharacterized protein n=1 Tax=Hyaloscypha bicolor E TaxID=1095630 RepID=A0A2J6TVM3_9HELO|nr:uncharacterized protein K444DRAFT_4645 [Hyaloscypha bicolor E]PMD67041.1 hypothetical protein K444DRAFT_4645 [Hyaloscypha bicolor E]